jgi:ribosomal protein S18 acetylase RimI-like enzyme
MLLEEKGGVQIVRLSRPEEVVPFRPSFVGAYQTIFAEGPYFERFYPSEAAAVLTRVLQTPDHVALLATKGATGVAGFGFALPLASRPHVASQMQGLLPIQHTFYLAELGVLGEYRNHGLGRSLVEHRLAAIDRQKFTHVVLRTSISRDGSYDLYSRLGFEDIGVYMEVPSRRLNGQVTTDRRLFLSLVL